MRSGTENDPSGSSRPSEADNHPEPGDRETGTMLTGTMLNSTMLNGSVPNNMMPADNLQTNQVSPGPLSNSIQAAKKIPSFGTRTDQDVVARPRNRFLAALPDAVWLSIASEVRHCLLFPGQSLYRSGQSLDRVFFPNSGLVSLVMDSREGTQVEIGVVGREGIVGALAVLGNQPAIGHGVVQIAGNACWLPAPVLRNEFKRGGALQQWLLLQLQLITAQAAQCALCNRIHSVEERLSRWLLIVSDRIESNDIEITHEFIAHMLGTRRSGVTVALGTLQQEGLIDLSRGHVLLTDRDRLQQCACECYSILSRQFETLTQAYPAESQ